MFWKKAKHDASNKAVLFLFFGVALSVLLLTVIAFNAPDWRGSAGDETAAPDFSRILPAGWVAIDGTAVSFDDVVLPTYVVACESSGAGGLALVVWNKTDKNYRTVSQLSFREVDSRLVGRPTIAVEELGTGVPQTLRVTAGLNNLSAQGVFYVARDGDRLVPVRMRLGTGEVRPAFFIDGILPEGRSQFAVQDVDGDGSSEAVLRRRTFQVQGALGDWVNSVSAFKWIDGLFVYDQELSWALTKSAEIFPEPANPPLDAGAVSQ